ncbi:Glucanosyltransferase-domain-containing protein [Pyrenochaeta sp. MPI-SDFR-AT-0127]|nr:Glucanosyltransferase-domain-containing protein [Pyrenochaeta sp. MPI-SDFR-AT-0127]
MMKMLVTLVLLAVAPVALALDFAAARGPFLVNNKTRGAITMNGIWYSLSNSTTDVNAMDSLNDAEACTRDAALMAQLGINTIYVMAIDPKENHDACFSIFNSVGIYIIVALRTEGIFGLTYDEFAGSYTTDYLKGIFEVIDAVKDYDNLLGFDLGVMPLVGFFVSPAKDLTYAAGQKLYRAFVRDTKEYIAKHATRPILVGATLHLARNDELLQASYLTQSHVHWFSCAVDGKKDDFSKADYVSFWSLGYGEIDPVKKQIFTMRSIEGELTTATVPTWFQMYGVSDEADYVEYELRPDLLEDTFYLYNSSSQLVQPNGALTGGARFTWTNTNLGWKVPISNWGIVTTGPGGDVQLTPNYDRLREMFSQMYTGNWLSGSSIDNSYETPVKCDASNLKNTTTNLYFDEPTTVTIATDWALPTRPSGLDALITSGASGKRGKMVDVTITTIVHAIKDSKGNAITDIVLKPSKSGSAGTASTATSTGAAGSPFHTEGKTGVGAGIALAALAALF